MIFANQPDNSEKGAGGRNQKPLLLVLLALVAVFAYLYFFTGLIKPRQEEPAPSPPVAEVKKPLPPRSAGDKGALAETAVKAPDATSKAAPAEQKPKGDEPAAAVKPQPVPAPAPAAKASEKAAPAKAVAPPVKEAAKPAPAGKEATKSAPAAEGNGKGKAPQQAASGEKAPKVEKGALKPAPAPADKAKKPAKNDAAAAAKKDVAGKKADKEPVKKTAGAAKKATVTLLVGEFVPDREFLALQTRLKNMGLSPLHKTELKKAKPMNRLYVGEYPNYEAGAAELERIKKLSADAFFIEADGKYRVYAGSYYGSKMADQVKSGLAAKGVATTLQKADVPVTVVRLTAGRFADKAAAAATIKKLKATGLAPAVVPLAR